MRHVTTTTLQTRRCLRAALRRWFVDDPDVTLVPPQRQNPAWTSPEHNAHEKQLPSRISKYSSTDSLNPAPCCISHHHCPSAGAGGQVRAGPPPAAAAARPLPTVPPGWPPAADLACQHVHHICQKQQAAGVSRRARCRGRRSRREVRQHHKWTQCGKHKAARREQRLLRQDGERLVCGTARCSLLNPTAVVLS